MKEPIVVIRDRFMYPSEAFLQEQIRNIDKHTKYKTTLIGTRRVNVPCSFLNISSLSFDDFYGSYKSRLYEILYKSVRITPKDYIAKVKNLKPVLAHAHFGLDAYEFLPIVKKLYIPLITTFHGYDVLWSEARKQTLRYKRFWFNRQKLIQQSSVIIAVSNFLRNKLISKGFPENKVITHYIGVDTEKFKYVNQSFKERKNIVLYVGRLNYYKGCEYLIDAIDMIEKNSEISKLDLELHIVGDGPRRNFLEEKWSKLKSKVVYYKALDHSQLVTLYQKAKVFCLPSTKTENEGPEAFGIVYAEAQSCGTPVVAFNEGGVPEVVKHSETGFLCNSKDVEMLSNFISILLNNSNVWNMFSNNAANKIRREFDIVKQTKKLEEIYNGAIKDYNIGKKVY